MTSSPQVIGLITARGGSKGIPGKNLRSVAGKPLIVWTIEAALSSGSLQQVLVSTDDPQISEISRRAGADTPFLRPTELAQDHSPHIDVAAHAIAWLDQNAGANPGRFLLLLQPTSPMRSAHDIQEIVKIGVDRNAEAVVGVCEARNHPYLCRSLTEDGRLRPFLSVGPGYLQRQDLPPAYAVNGALYLNRQDALLRDRTFVPDSAYAYVMPPERSIDVDTVWDLRIVDLLLREKGRE